MEVDCEILARIQAGDRAAFDELYLVMRDPLLCSIRARMGRTLRRQVESEDVLHSAMREAIDDLPGFVPRGAGSLRRWFHTCVLNKIRKKAEHAGAARRRGGEPLSDSLAERLEAAGARDGRYLDADRWDRLERAMEALDAESREVVLLRAVEGATNAEAAEAVKKSEDATSKIYRRALARLGVSMGGGAAGP